MRLGLGLISVFAALASAVDMKPLSAGKEAPTFSLPALSGKREMLSVWCGEKLSKPYLNKEPHVVVLSFWATYCKPCQKEIPQLMQFQKEHADKKIKIFCISIDKEGASAAGPFVKKKGYTLPVLLDPYQKTAERYGVRSLPALVVIGPDRVIRYSSTGYKEGEPFLEKLESAVAAAFEGRNYQEFVDDDEAESVAVEGPVTDSRKQVPGPIAPKQKWEAVASVECGAAIEDVADEIGVTPAEIRGWYSDLKQAAIELWQVESSPVANEAEKSASTGSEM